MTGKNNLGIGKIRLILFSAMGLVFFSLGCVLLFTKIYSENIPSPNRYYIGGVLVIWGIFRVFSSYRFYLRTIAEESDEEEDA